MAKTKKRSISETSRWLQTASSMVVKTPAKKVKVKKGNSNGKSK